MTSNSMLRNQEKRRGWKGGGGNREGEGEGEGRGFSWPTHSCLCTLLLFKFVVATERLLLFKFSQMLQEFFVVPYPDFL